MREIKGVEILAAGIWNGQRITEKTLEEIVTAFKATKDFAKPVLKLGHNEEQPLLKADGLPAAGWVSNIYIKGKKLLADFSDIPAKIWELIKKKAYNKVSVEIFSGYKFKDTKYPNLLGAVALLGQDIPAVRTLNDILSNYELSSKFFTFEKSEDTIEMKNVLTDESQLSDGGSVAEKKMLEELQATIESQKKELSLMGDKVKEFKDTKESIQKSFSVYKAETDKKLAALAKERRDAEIQASLLELEKKELLAPSIKPFALAFLSKDASKFSVADKELSSKELLEEILKLSKELSKISTKEKTADLKPIDGGFKNIDKEIKELQTKNPDLTYAQGYKQVMRGK